MVFYPHYIGDFIRDTARLTDSQSMAYLRLIWEYYATEQPLDDDINSIAFKIGSNSSDVEQILKHFFFLHDGKWHQSKCDEVIAGLYGKSEKARNSARARWDKRKKNANALRTHSECNANEPKNDATQYTIPNTQEEPKNKTTAALKRDESVVEVFEHWKLTMNHGHARLDSKRTKQIAAALSLGYSVEDLCGAITGCSMSPFHMGDNDKGQKYDGLDLILRDGSKIDQFIGFYHNPPKKQSQQPKNQNDRSAAFAAAIMAPFQNNEIDVTPQTQLLGAN